MSIAHLPQHKPFFSLREKINLQFPVLLTSWLILTSLCGIFIAGLMMDGFLRNILENKERELLASRHLTLSLTYRQTGLAGVGKLLRQDAFKRDFIQLASPNGTLLLDQNPDGIRFSHPLLPMPTIAGHGNVPDWLETTTDRGLDYDLLYSEIHDGHTLMMGLNEAPQEKFVRRSERVSAQAGGTFLLVGLLGASIFIFRFWQQGAR